MSLSTQLERWQHAGLIDSATASAIAEFESSKRRPALLYGMSAIGAGTIGVGLISIVAANWDGISATAKLGADLGLGAALAVLTYRSARHLAGWRTDTLCIVYYLFTLASIALVGQIYQLGSPTWMGLGVWSASTLPLMWIGRGRFLGGLWAIGLGTTLALLAKALIRWVDTRSRVDNLEDELAALLSFALPATLLVLSRIAWITRAREQLAAGFRGIVVLTSISAALGAQFLWYSNIRPEETLGIGLLGCAAIAFGLASCARTLFPELDANGHWGVRTFLVLTTGSLICTAGFEHSSAPAAGAVLQIALLAALAWTSAHAGSLRGFNTLTALIGVRIVIAYVEVFGSMLDTGLGMIIGGSLTLLLAWIWKRLSPELAAALTAGERETSHAA